MGIKHETVGNLAALELIKKCDTACRKLATWLDGIEIAGIQLSSPSLGNSEGSWLYLQMIIDRLDAEGTSRVEKLAADTVRRHMNEALRKHLVNSTNDMVKELPDGERFWEQYSDGLITESEYMHNLIIAVADWEPKAA